MPKPAASPLSPTPAARPIRVVAQPFFGLLDAVLVPGPAEFQSDGAISRPEAEAVWLWLARDVAPDLIDLDAEDIGAAAQALDGAAAEILQRAQALVAEAGLHKDKEKRLRAQLGSDVVWARLPVVLHALKCRGLYAKAEVFGRAVNGIADDAGLVAAMQSMPWQDRAAVALLMQAALAEVGNPARLVTAAIRLAGGAGETALQRSGFAPLIEAILAHAQAQIAALEGGGLFADMDRICRAVNRFHRLCRSINTYVELSRMSRWSSALGGLTRAISDRLEPRLREVAPDLNRALRKPAGDGDRLDADAVLGALNGCYLLSMVRDCRDSLAVNAVFEQTWTQVGEALELHLQRNLELFRFDPRNEIVAARLDAALKLAELRFNPEYAEVLRRARDTAERRL